jgi:hypothetical protein
LTAGELFPFLLTEKAPPPFVPKHLVCSRAGIASDGWIASQAARFGKMPHILSDFNKILL